LWICCGNQQAKQTHIIVLLIYPTMKAVVFASLIGSAAAFAPAPTGKMAS
jgi:hypothetical protein